MAFMVALLVRWTAWRRRPAPTSAFASTASSSRIHSCSPRDRRARTGASLRAASTWGVAVSCPHGLPERKMGMAMGEDPELVCEVVGWVKEVATIPVWAKMTPNVGHPAAPAKAAVKGGADGISAINTILSVVGVDLATLRPL